MEHKRAVSSLQLDPAMKSIKGVRWDGAVYDVVGWDWPISKARAEKPEQPGPPVSQSTSGSATGSLSDSMK